MFKASKSSLSVNIQTIFSDRDAQHKFTLRGINYINHRQKPPKKNGSKAISQSLIILYILYTV